ncbi:peptide/nickel transport system substrate-binding protein [Deinococcus metalli]|uniref:Glutathione ABC transporter substrate-binding protein n=1 Tax=Deinococcus metalli TaxID=1141878 RepID=A0A7W8KED3_9DEIO|nr:ABC transporter substrate-binding protein [Deinococcus metalli]MBB5376630.1 peptide/nickel transport system substrate-binding protein [Deinococcus metalli]GHF42656.1 glutathione ABC transporter substrate-binding protein [Deinococcus metalli]
MKTFLRAALVSSMLLVTASAQQVTRGGTLQLAVDQSPVGLDPHVATAFSTFVVTGQIYEGLLDIDPALKIRPLLASKYTRSDDGLTYTFTLRSGVKFHNGDPFTAADVVYSMNRVKDSKTASPLASRLASVTSVKASSPTQVTFTLSKPYAPFLSEVATIAIVDQKYVEGGGNLQRAAVGTGPFVLKQWIPDTALLLDKNPSYWAKGQPYLDGLKFNIVPDASTRQLGLQSGTYQFLPNIDASVAVTLKGARSVQLLRSQDLAYSLLGMNVTRKPFDDPRVREALNYAINRPEIVQGVYFGDAQPGGPIPPALKAYATPVNNFPCYSYNPAKARDLLRQAGYPNGVDFSILTFSTIKTVADTAQVLQAELAPAGFRAKIDIQEFGSFVQNWRNSNFDAFVSQNGGSIDPDGQLYRTVVSGGSTNVFKYKDPAVDALLEQGRSTTSNGSRVRTYAQLQKTLACRGPLAFLAYGALYSAARSEVRGFTPNPTRSLAALKTTWISKE